MPYKRIVFADSDLSFLDRAKQFSSKLEREIVTTTKINELIKIVADHGKNIDVIAINIDPFTIDQLRNLRAEIDSSKNGHIKVFSISSPLTKFSITMIEKLKALVPFDNINKSHSTDKTLYRIIAALFDDKRKRRNLRTLINFPVKCQLGDETFEAKSYSLSKEGIFIETTKPLTVNSTLTIFFLLPSSTESLEISCKVIYELKSDQKSYRVAPCGFGLKFLDLPDGTKEKLDHFVKNYE
jgi:hypothetical protein